MRTGSVYYGFVETPEGFCSRHIHARLATRSYLKKIHGGKETMRRSGGRGALPWNEDRIPDYGHTWTKLATHEPYVIVKNTFPYFPRHMLG